jgi:chromosome segregation ATPase
LSSEQEPVQKELQDVKKDHQKMKEARDSINRQITNVNARKDEIFADIPGLVSEQVRFICKNGLADNIINMIINLFRNG